MSSPPSHPHKQVTVLKDILELLVLLDWTCTLTKVLKAAKLSPKSLPIIKEYVYQIMAARNTYILSLKIRFQLSHLGENTKHRKEKD